MGSDEKTTWLRTHWVLLVLMLIGTGLRLWGIAEKSLWIDEAQAVWKAQHSLEWITQVSFDPRSHEPPARLHLLHGIIELFGTQEWALRLPALIGGILLIPLTWGLARLLGGPKAGQLAAALATFSPTLIEHSQDARFYTLILLFEIWSLLSLLRAMEEPARWSLWLRAGMAAGLAFHLSYISAFVIGPVGLVAAGLVLRPGLLGDKDPKRVRQGAAITLGIMGLAVLPLAVPLTQTALRIFGGQQEVAIDPVPLGQIFVPLWRSNWLGELIHPLLPVALIMLPLALWGFVGVWKNHRPGFWLLMLVIGVTLILGLGSGMLFGLSPRYLIHLHLLAMILVPVALLQWKPKGGLAVGFTLFAIGTLIVPLGHQLAKERQPWRPAVEFILQGMQANDAILTGALWSERPVYLYVPQSEWNRIVPNVRSEQELELRLRSPYGVWFIAWGEMPPSMREFLQTHFNSPVVFEGTRGNVSVWERPRPSGVDPSSAD